MLRLIVRTSFCHIGLNISVSNPFLLIMLLAVVDASKVTQEMKKLGCKTCAQSTNLKCSKTYFDSIVKANNGGGIMSIYVRTVYLSYILLLMS
jgi:hypothetical protein